MSPPSLLEFPNTPSPVPEVVRFRQGLLGFPQVREYRLSAGPGHGLYWLTAPEGVPSFILADPFRYFEGLDLELSPEQAEAIGAEHPSDVAVLAVAVPSAEPEGWTANLQGPVVVNLRTALAAQMVLPDQSLGVRRRFRPALAEVDSVDAQHPLRGGVAE